MTRLVLKILFVLFVLSCNRVGNNKFIYFEHNKKGRAFTAYFADSVYIVNELQDKIIDVFEKSQFYLIGDSILKSKEMGGEFFFAKNSFEYPSKKDISKRIDELKKTRKMYYDLANGNWLVIKNELKNFINFSPGEIIEFKENNYIKSSQKSLNFSIQYPNKIIISFSDYIEVLYYQKNTFKKNKNIILESSLNKKNRIYLSDTPN